MNGPEIDEIATRIPAHVAQLAVARAYAVAGSEADWDSGTIERVMFCLEAALPHMLSGGDLPSPYSIEPDAAAFWAARLADQ